MKNSYVCASPYSGVQIYAKGKSKKGNKMCDEFTDMMMQTCIYSTYIFECTFSCVVICVVLYQYLRHRK